MRRVISGVVAAAACAPRPAVRDAPSPATMLVTVDGRQPGYSVGMTLREAAGLALDLGATDAINLDGGGSTAMVVRRGSSGSARYEVVNRPSDPQGERPVGNALALVCGPQR